MSARGPHTTPTTPPVPVKHAPWLAPVPAPSITTAAQAMSLAAPSAPQR